MCVFLLFCTQTNTAVEVDPLWSAFDFRYSHESKFSLPRHLQPSDRPPVVQKSALSTMTEENALTHMDMSARDGMVSAYEKLLFSSAYWSPAVDATKGATPLYHQHNINMHLIPKEKASSPSARVELSRDAEKFLPPEQGRLGQPQRQLRSVLAETVLEDMIHYRPKV